MGKPIATTKLGENLHCEGDKFFSGQALANAGATTSSEFLLALTMGAQQLVIAADGEVATGVGETLVISVKTADAENGTYDNEIYSKTIPASTTIADGDSLAEFVAPRNTEECWTQVTITSDFDATGLSVDGFIVGLC